MAAFSADLESLFSAIPVPSKRLAYGTAGFRDKANIISGTICRVGVFACIRSRWANSQFVGIMITASHNPECDNGAKLADTDGGMLSADWEPYIEEFANCRDPAEACRQVKKLISEKGIRADIPAHVVLGRDTRPSSFDLFESACRGVEAFGGIVHDIGTVTTPQLHFVVREMNKRRILNPEQFPVARDGLESYYTIISEGYLQLKATAPRSYPDKIIIDCSNGIGARSVVSLGNVLSELNPDSIYFDVRNSIGDGAVNEGCGAELVQKEQRPPLSVSAEDDNNEILCSFDGDADRIVFHSFDTSSKWHLADGDKIACLLASLLKEEMEVTGLLPSITMGVVQTAYANGSSTHYLRSKDIPVLFTKTGVKYLHRKAHEAFDVGVYFEANGHGTVLFSETFSRAISQWSDSLVTIEDRVALGRRRILVII
jgi:phosphoacetylglucosamine mutase